MAIWVELVLALVVVVVMAPFVALVARRLWLARHGNSFECSLRPAPDDTSPSPRWRLGFARYRDQVIEWYPVVSLNPRPARRFVRRVVVPLRTRDLGRAEHGVLDPDQRVLRLHDLDTGQEWETALRPTTMTALMSWFEAAPPGVRFESH